MMPNIETNEIQKENQDQIVEEALERLKRKLLDLSRRNSLLNYKAGRNSIRIVDELPAVISDYLVNKGKSMVLNPLPDPEPETEDIEVKPKNQNLPLITPLGHDAENQKDVKAVNDGINTKHELPTANSVDSEKKHIDNKLQTDLVSQVLERRCKKISAECRRSIEESGINIFFLAIGFLEWYEDDHSDVKNKAPLILIPVSIEKTVLDRETNCYRYVISYNEEDIETNLSLVEKLSINFNIILPSTEDFTPEEYFDETSNAVSHRRRWRVAREAILGFFSFAKIRIYKDLCASDGGSGFIASHPLVKQIIAGREREEKEFHVTGRVDDIDIDEYEKENAPLLLVREADSSQYSAVVDVVHNGKNLCIDGPPGTGKSQTITNIIANALCNDKSVLFVSEKKAALEVVRNRLNQHELGDYCLELHSQKTQKIKLYEGLGRRLAIGNVSNPSNLDIEIKRLEEEKDKLKKYYDILHEKPAATDDTIYEIFWKTDRWRSALNTEPPHFSLEAPHSITNGTISEVVRIVEDFVKLREELPDDIYLLWHGFEPNVLVPGDDEEIRVWLEEIIKTFQTFDSFYKEFIETHSFPESPFFSSADRLSAIDGKIVSVPPDVPLAIYQKLFDSNNTALVNELSTKVREYKELTKDASQIFGESLPPIADLDGINLLVEKLRVNGLGELSVYGLQETHKMVVQPVSAALNELDYLLTEIKAFSAINVEKVCDFNIVNKLSVVLSNSPADLVIHAHPEHSLKYALQCLEKARAEDIRLKSRLRDISANIKVEKETRPQELDAIADGLQKGTSWFQKLFSSEYRDAKKKCLILLQDLHSFKKQKLLPQQIRELAILRSEEYNFAEEDDARKVLGPLFKGTNTDWERLSKLVCWSQSLSGTLLSEGKAKLFLANFSENLEKSQRILARTSELVTAIKDGANKLGISFLDDSTFMNLKNDFTAKRILIEEAQQFFAELHTPTNCDFDTLSDGVQAALAAKDVYENISSQDYKYSQVLGVLYQGVETELSLLLAATNWLDTQSKALLGESHIEWILEDKTGERVELLKELISKAIHFHGGINNFKKRIGTKGSIDFSDWAEMQDGHIELSEIADLLRTKLDSVNYIMSWSEYNFTKQKFTEQKFEQLADVIEAGTIKPNEAVFYARYIIYQNMAKEVIKRYPDLATFQRVSYENIRRRISTISEAIKKLSEKRICHILVNKSIPYGNGTGRKKDYTDLCLIMNEVSKKKRHVPIRQLISRARDALIAMKPCFMMSPLSVAQYLGPGLPFDLVVMDEASQLRLEDAIGAVARGKQLVVVGDPKQLPPSSFFQTDNIYTEVEEEEMTAAEDTESILDICQVNFETRRLKWHYRSAHESLIAFSNKEFYDNELIVFPSPYQGTNSLGMNYHFIDGAKYAKGKNRIEAQRVAMAVVDHFKKSPQLSLGVATFNTEQRDLINDELERIQKENRWLETAIKETEDTEEPFFVKNLETVQGDERSVIMISITYGPDINTGIVNQRFGPINRDTGWRRLNVIATRAKQRIDLFTSMKGSDIKVHPGSSRGVIALRKYLDFAEKGILTDFGTVTGKEPDSDFEIAVMALLDRHGYKTVPQVGVAGFFIDIGVYNPYREKEFLCGIECDGATYHSTKSIKDRDVLRQQILKSKGWDIYRIWSTDWFKNRERERDRLLGHLEQLAEEFRLSRNEQLVEEESLEYGEETQEKDASLKKISESIIDYTPDKELREALSEYRQKKMTEKEASSSGCILSDTMINLLLATMPVNSNEFLSKIPLGMRESIDTGQGKYLPEIFNIIEEFADL
jgi:very-short-patch-repair endonuclease